MLRGNFWEELDSASDCSSDEDVPKKKSATLVQKVLENRAAIEDKDSKADKVETSEEVCDRLQSAKVNLTKPTSDREFKKENNIKVATTGKVTVQEGHREELSETLEVGNKAGDNSGKEPPQKGRKRKKKLAWTFETKRRWEMKSNM